MLIAVTTGGIRVDILFVFLFSVFTEFSLMKTKQLTVYQQKSSCRETHK